MMITKTLAVFSPTIGARSETLIKRHITDLFLGRTVVVCAYAADTVNEWEINDPALFIRNAPPLPRYIRIVRSIKRRLRLHHDP